MSKRFFSSRNLFRNRWQIFSLLMLFFVIFLAFFQVDVQLRFDPPRSASFEDDSSVQVPAAVVSGAVSDVAVRIEDVLPENGFVLPIEWGDLGEKLLEEGVIDKAKFEALYQERGDGLSDQQKQILSGSDNDKIVINKQNAGFLLNMFWAFGLGNKNSILENGPMTGENYGGDASRFASTGGWSLSAGDPMDHYSKHAFVELDEEQQALVERVSQNIYRPCCGNSTYFPDCNHGMAMLGLLELMADQDVSEQDMYRTALQVNAFWFPDTYLTLAKYFATQGDDWSDIDPKLLLSATYSSSAGYKQILAKVQPVSGGGGGGCGV